MAQNGTLTYGQRAFMQDAGQAMLGHIDRALIELITNADDAYGNDAGPIYVEVDKDKSDGSFLVSVMDQAKGLTSAEMLAAFTEIGGQQAKLTQGGMSRGLLGRGAKDVAIFGQVTFVGYKNGAISNLTIYPNMHWSMTLEDEPATDAQLKEYGFTSGKPGLLVTVLVKDPSEFPKANVLKQDLGNTIQLRDLVKRREVFYTDFRDPGHMSQVETTLPEGSIVLDQVITVQGATAQSARLVVRRLPSRQTSSLSEKTAHGLALKSGVSVFQNTWFDLTNKPESKLLAGSLELDYLMEYLRAEATSDTPPVVSLLTRTRDGLNKQHPEFRAISEAVVRAVTPIMDAIAAEDSTVRQPSEALKKDLQVLATALRDDLLNMLKELDDEQPTGGSGSDLPDFTAVPRQITASPGERFTISLRVKAPETKSLPSFKVEVGALTDGLGASSGAIAKTWRVHPRLSGYGLTDWQGVCNSLGESVVTFTTGGNSARVLVRCVPTTTKVVADPTSLRFAVRNVTASPGRGKNLKIIAPIEYVDEDIQVEWKGLSPASIPTSIQLTEADSGRYAEGVVHVKTGSESGVLVVTVTALDGSKDSAEIEVKEPGTGTGLEFTFNLDPSNESQERYYLQRTDGNISCTIYGRHKSFAGVFGKFEEGRFTNENHPVARAVLAQVIAQALADNLVQLGSQKQPEDYRDADAVLFSHRRFADRMLHKIHNALVQIDDK